MEEALLHEACRYSGTKVTNWNKIVVGSGHFSFVEKNCVFLSAVSGTFSAKWLVSLSKHEVLRLWEKKCYFFATIFYRINRFPFKANAGSGGGAGEAPFLWDSSDRWTSLYHETVFWGALSPTCCVHDPAHRLSIQPTESVWWLKREVGKSTWWVYSDLNLSYRRTQMNCFWSTIFISSLSLSRDMSPYSRFKVEKTFSGA